MGQKKVDWKQNRFLFPMHELTNYWQLFNKIAVVMIEFTIKYFL